MIIFNHWQRALISHAIRHPRFRYTVEGHRRSHKVVYETARADLIELKEKGVFESQKVGKTWNFFPAHDIVNRLTAQHAE